jgi:hypothetical protein
MGFRSLRRMMGLLWCSPHVTVRQDTHGNLASGTPCTERETRTVRNNGYEPLGLGAVQEIFGSRPT